MRWWLRPLFSILVWLALFASQMPTPAWSCSMTGRVGDETAICRGMPPGLICCSKSDKPCCKPLPFPPLPFNSDDRRSHNILVAVRAFNLAADSVKTVDFGQQALSLVTPPAISVVTPVATRSYFSTAPPFLTLHRPASLASRAPPIALLS
ncbi:MAG TPA: hypothetical protein VGB77_09785 [Abditibacteriaceae bacterium]